MKLWEAVLMGAREMVSHKMRSLLTVLGVILGVAAVVSMVSITEGARVEAITQFKYVGTHVFQVHRAIPEEMDPTRAEEKSPFGMTLGDADALSTVCEQIVRVAPIRRVHAALSSIKNPPHADVLGTTEDLPIIRGFEIEKGRFLLPSDGKDYRRVCVLGASLARALYPLDDPIGKPLKLNELWFTIIGVLKEKDITSASSQIQVENLNETVFLPISTASADFQIQTAERVSMSIRDVGKMWRKSVSIQRLETQRIFNLIMGAIAGISLVIGGIGIMNIMLVTVVQRTREIGIRRCIGAKKSDILLQFLVECLVVTVLGGLIGIGLGAWSATLIASYAKWKTVVSANAVILSFLVAVATGVIFGLYPAMKAASVLPIEALRYE
ncbi:MAG: ABC transporter permease [Armatimonadetes bacterium]|nr:ABC transporter permease [Armatimonadota bacterium]